MTTQTDLDQAFIDFDLDVPQVRIADITNALMEIASSIEAVLEELSQTPEPAAGWLTENAALLRELRSEQDTLITNALDIVAEMTVRKENRR